MHRLFILRHVNTAWALPGQRDFDRELNEDGVEDLGTLRSWIAENNVSPQHVYCSSAQRTRATFDGIKPSLPAAVSVDYMDNFYSGFIDEYLSAVQSHHDASTLMIVGHNPTCASLVSLLVSPDDVAGSHAVSNSFPAGALAAIDFEIDQWSDLKRQSGKLAEFFIPRSSQRYEAH